MTSGKHGLSLLVSVLDPLSLLMVLYVLFPYCNYFFELVFFSGLEELVRSNHLEDANTVFLKGAEGGLRATDELYDLLIEEDCRVGDHSNALTIAYEMEAAGRMATTFHFNCLLSVQVSSLNLLINLSFFL